MKNKFNPAALILLALIIALTPAAAFCESDIEQADAEVAAQNEIEVTGLYEMNFLNSLGIVSFTEGMLAKSVTNEEFAGAAGLIGGIVSDYYQDGALDMLVKCGYLPSACAYPDRAIKYMQAVKGMVSVLGYDAPAQNYGGYPNGYIIEASKLKITDGIDNTDNEAELTYAMLCIMMYNALDVRLMVQTVYGSDATYKKEDTVINGVFEIYEEYGRVTANSVTSLSGINSYNPGRIEIDGIEFNNSNSAYDDYFGYNVRYYYKTENTDVHTVLYMEIDEAANKLLEVDENDGTYVEDKNIYYYTQNGRFKSVSISDGYCLVYNKRVTKNGLESYEGSINGYVKLADTDRDGKYDFIEINSYDTIYVSKINSYDSEIFDKYDVKKSASFDEKIHDTKYIIKDSKGNDIAFSSIKKGNVVSVIMSEDKEVATAIVSGDTVSVTVDAVSNPGNESRAYIYSGDKKYPVSDSVKNYLGNIALGEEYRLAFDFSGYIAGFENSEDVFETGLIMGTDVESGSGLKNEIQIKIFSSDGKAKIFNFAEKVKVDGVKYKENSDACDALYKTADGKKVYKSKLIRYCIKNDKIINIDTAFYNEGVESEESLQLVGPERSMAHSRDGQCFIATDSSGFVYDSATTVFLAYRTDLPEYDESEYSVLKYSDFPNGYTVPNVSGYATNAKTPDVEFVVVGLTNSFDTQLAGYNYITMMFESVSRRLDENGEEKYCVYGVDLLKNAKIERLVDDITKLSGIARGDILNIRFTYSGEIGSLYKAYDAKSDSVLFTDSCSLSGGTTGTSNAAKWFHGRAYSAGASYVYVLPESKADLIDEAALSDCKMTAVKRRQAQYYVYDTTESKDKDFLTAVTNDSVNDYLNTGAGADKVLVSTYASEYSAVVIFR